MSPISSTLIREKIRKNENIKNFVPSEIVNYINIHKI